MEIERLDPRHASRRVSTAATVLTEDQRHEFRERGCVTVADAVTADQLAALRRDFDLWVRESREHDAAYGETIDGRPRFDLEPGHSARAPALRRVASPSELSEAYLDVLTGSRMIDMVADLIGPDIRLHHSKINSKLPGAATKVDWHQDFTYDPHSNDDVVTALLFLDDVTDDNGPFLIVPGSHKGPLLSLWQKGRFTGAVDAETARRLDGKAEARTGSAGSVCLMHARLAHASGVNRSSRARTLFIAVIAAAVPLAPNPLPSRHAGIILRGREPGRVRSTAFEMELPEQPTGASFFVQQAGAAADTT